MEHPPQADRKEANKAAPVTPVAAAVKGGMPTPKSGAVTPKASPGPGSNNEHGVSASKKELVVPSKAQSIVARMRQIPVPKPSSRPVTPKTEPAGDAPGFATPPPPAKASTPVPSPVSPPVTPTVRESPGTLILIDLEEPVAPTVSEREAAASAQEAHLHNTAAVETAVGGGSGEKQAPLAEEREPQKDAPEVEALPNESAKATDSLPRWFRRARLLMEALIGAASQFGCKVSSRSLGGSSCLSCVRQPGDTRIYRGCCATNLALRNGRQKEGRRSRSLGRQSHWMSFCGFTQKSRRSKH